jgi:hypothetical protein
MAKWRITMRKIVAASLVLASLAISSAATAGKYDPRSAGAKCAKQLGGHLVITVPGKHWHWQTDNIPGWNKCLYAASVREAYGSMERSK